MKARTLIVAGLTMMMTAGCSKPAEDNTYVPPPNIKPVEKGTIYIGLQGDIAYELYLNNKRVILLDGGTYYQTDVVPGVYAVKGIQAEKVKPGEKPKVIGKNVTIVSGHKSIVTIP